ncbi:MAG: class I SAM-dependent methyltransferase [Burkholderiales bacterium]
MSPEQYDAWYRTSRGAWIGEIERRLLCEALAPSPAESLIDVGCGTGYFTRRFARDGLAVTGVDGDRGALDFARTHAAAGERYLPADARRLPFPDRSFDLCVSVAALCFVAEESQALAEMLRVTRRRFAIGLLNRHSLLFLQKGRHGGRGAYRGARWHTIAEAKALFAVTPARDVTVSSAVFLPSGGPGAQLLERWLPGGLPFGAFLVATGALGERGKSDPSYPGGASFA